MNPLQIDPATGFLTSPSPTNYGFTAEKKIHFLELATAYRKESKFPKVSLICDQLGIDIRSFERHLELDTNFKEAFDEIAKHIEYECISDMSDLRKKQPLFMFGLLRYLNPKRWAPDAKLSITVDNRSVSPLFDRASSVDTDASPAGAPQSNALPSRPHILAKETE